MRFMFQKDKATKSFIHTFAIYILNKLLLQKTNPDSEDARRMAFDILGQTAPSQKIFKKSEDKIKEILRIRKDELLKFIDEIFAAFLTNQLQTNYKVGAPFGQYKNHQFLKTESATQGKSGYIAFEENEEIQLSQEMGNFLKEVVSIIRRRYKNETRLYLIYSKTLEPLFQEVREIILNFRFHLLPYVSDIRKLNELKNLIDDVHKVNLNNILDAFESYVGNKNMFVEQEYHKDLFESLNSSY